MISIYNFKDYKQFIRNVVKENKHVRGYLGQLANAAGCHRSYLSQILTREVELTPDHVFKLSNYWNLKTAESDYFMLLLQYARASTWELKEHLSKKIESTISKRDNLSERYSNQYKKLEGSSAQAMYYSTWYIAAIHLLCGIDKYNTKEKISSRLQISEVLIDQVLEELKKMKLIIKNNESWSRTNHHIHLENNSPFINGLYNNWRQKAVSNIDIFNNQNLNYSCPMTISQNDYRKIKRLMLKLIDDTREICKDSRDEELYCLNFDLFRV